MNSGVAMEAHPWQNHRFLHQVRQALVSGHNQCFLYGRNVEKEWFHNGPVLGVQDLRETLAYNLIYVEGGLTERVVVIAKTGMSLYSRPATEDEAVALRLEYPRNAHELEALLRGEKADSGPTGVLGGGEREGEPPATLLTPLDEASLPETFHRITRLMGELQAPFSVVVDGFQWIAELFTGRQHRLELVEEINRWAGAALGGRSLSMILLPDLEPLKNYLPLREEDINVIYVSGPSVREIAKALMDFVARAPGHFSGLPGLDCDDYLVIASALKNRGYTLLNAVHHFDRFVAEAGSAVLEAQDAFIRAFKQDLGLNLDDVRWDEVHLPAQTRAAIENLFQRFLDDQCEDPPKGMLLHGPPGTGKTHIARALANWGGFYFQPLKLADLKGRYVGESGRNVQTFFAEARASAPTLMFIDEIDAVLGRRGGREQDSFSNDIVNQFLAETDGVDTGRQKIFIATTTNRPDLVDPAVKSRLPLLKIGLPDAACRRAMLEQGLDGEVTLNDVNMERLVARTDGLSGRDIRKTLCEQIRQHHQAVDPDPVAAGMQAMRRIIVEQLGSGPAHIRLAGEEGSGLDELIGYEEYKAQLRELGRELFDPDSLLERFGIQPRNGLLLYGPPGNGKTALVEALAREYRLDLMVISGSQLSATSGEGSIRGLDRLVDDALRIAVTGEGVLLFFDEFDALAQAPLEATFRSALLGNLDRVRRQGKILLAAATNKYDRLEPAAVRAERFDLYLPLMAPDAGVIARMIRHWSDQEPFNGDFEVAALEGLAEQWAGKGVSVSAVKIAVNDARRRAVLARAGEAGEEPIPIRLEDLCMAESQGGMQA